MTERHARKRRSFAVGGLVAKSGLEEVFAAVEPGARAVLVGALLHLTDEPREPAPGSPSPLGCFKVRRERGRAALLEEPVAAEEPAKAFT